MRTWHGQCDKRHVICRSMVFPEAPWLCGCGVSDRIILSSRIRCLQYRVAVSCQWQILCSQDGLSMEYGEQGWLKGVRRPICSG